MSIVNFEHKIAGWIYAIFKDSFLCFKKWLGCFYFKRAFSFNTDKKVLWKVWNSILFISNFISSFSNFVLNFSLYLFLRLVVPVKICAMLLYSNEHCYNLCLFYENLRILFLQLMYFGNFCSSFLRTDQCKKTYVIFKTGWFFNQTFQMINISEMFHNLLSSFRV